MTPRRVRFMTATRPDDYGVIYRRAPARAPGSRKRARPSRTVAAEVTPTVGDSGGSALSRDVVDRKRVRDPTSGSAIRRLRSATPLRPAHAEHGSFPIYAGEIQDGQV
jgi:hypothetical protein